MTARAPGSVHAEGLTRSFGGRTVLDDVGLDVPAGSLHALLGPNGAGKTTTVRILTTLLRADAGHAVVAGHDVHADPVAVRRAIGVSGQYAAVDEQLTGRENLHMLARLHGTGRRETRDRAGELLERFRLTDAAERRSGTYSGGMRRRLDLACALVARPSVVVLDEPTTGLDPRSRGDTWDVIGELLDDGVAVLLTTQYLEEADRLADQVTVIDRGVVAARGTPAELKSRVRSERVEIVLADGSPAAGLGADLDLVAAVLRRTAHEEPHVERRERRVRAVVTSGAAAVTAVVREADAAGIRLADLDVGHSTLDDVFFTLTGPSGTTVPDAPPAERQREGATR